MLLYPRLNYGMLFHIYFMFEIHHTLMLYVVSSNQHDIQLR